MRQPVGGARERGASAVEFALVVPVLLAVLMGIIDYGIWFNESLNLRQVVRESARQGVVGNFGGGGCAGTDMQKLACRTKGQLDPVAGTAYVRIVPPATGWRRGEPLLVCAMVKVDAVTGLTPLPSDGMIRSKTVMSIERDDPVATGGTEATAGGGDWSWCT